MSATTEQRTTVSVENHVATVTMIRADRHNALDEHMFDGLTAAIAEVSADPSVRVVVLHGDGPSFCSGLDVPSFMDGQGKTTADIMAPVEGQAANYAQNVAIGWQTMPAPVIAAIHGVAFGGGIQIALGADIRVCAPDAKLSIMESKWGLIPDMGITRTLSRLVPIDRAKELTYSGRVFSGQEALAMGIVTELADDPLARAQEIAATWAVRSPDAVQRAKRLFDTAWTLDDPVASLELEADLQRELLGSPNQIEAVRAGLAKETPNFT